MAESAEIQIDGGARSPRGIAPRAGARRRYGPDDPRPLPPVEAQRFRSVYVEDTFSELQKAGHRGVSAREARPRRRILPKERPRLPPHCRSDGTGSGITTEGSSWA